MLVEASKCKDVRKSRRNKDANIESKVSAPEISEVHSFVPTLGRTKPKMKNNVQENCRSCEHAVAPSCLRALMTQTGTLDGSTATPQIGGMRLAWLTIAHEVPCSPHDITVQAVRFQQAAMVQNSHNVRVLQPLQLDRLGLRCMHHLRTMRSTRNAVDMK